MKCLLTVMAMMSAFAAVESNAASVRRNDIYVPKQLPAKLSADGKTLMNGSQPLVVVFDPNISQNPLKIPAAINLMTAAQTASATFAIDYVAAGGADILEATCYAFPEEAKAAFEAAASIWGNIIKSDVPITIRACWSDLGESSTLGYSGGGSLMRDFNDAARSNTWYSSSLANALAGEDLDADNPDMHITYNRNFTWYYGVDGTPPSDQMDLLTVVLHEIAHGLNFSGTASYDSTNLQGSLGLDGFPCIYDVFVKDGVGTDIISYTSPSFALGTALRSGDLWFHGPNAMTANGDQRVKIYAPATWKPGSSYSHLDYDIFNNTANQLMVWAVSNGEAVHDPGPVAKGMLKDMGWPGGLPTLSSPSPADGAKVSSYNASARQLRINIANADNCTIYYGTDSSTSASVAGAISSGYCSATVPYGTDLTNEGTNYWHVEASNSEGTVSYPESGNLTFIASPIKPKLLPGVRMLLF
jgi:hypothetical protein